MKQFYMYMNVKEVEYIRVTVIEKKGILGAFDLKLRAFAEKKIRARPGYQLLQASVTGYFHTPPLILHHIRKSILQVHLSAWAPLHKTNRIYFYSNLNFNYILF